MEKIIYKDRIHLKVYKYSLQIIFMEDMTMIRKQLYLRKTDVNDWEEFCQKNFKTKRVLSKIVTEAMDEYIENFNSLK